MAQHGALSAPLLLAVESATDHLSVALLRGDELLQESGPEACGQHAERILPAVDRVLSAAGVRADELEAFAVSIGPGSFTSLRVGLATVKGLAFGSDRPVVPVPTLEALAFGTLEGEDSRPRVPLLDARRGEIYAAVFEVHGRALAVSVPDGLFSPDTLAALLPGRCRLVGPGAALFGAALRERAGDGVGMPESRQPAALAPRAADVGRLAAARLRAGFEPDPLLAPRYVRRAEAEAKRTRQEVEPTGPA